MTTRHTFTLPFDVPPLEDAGILCMGINLNGEYARWIQASLPFVTKEEQAHARRFVHTINQTHHLVGRALIRYVMLQNTPPTSTVQPFAYTPNGKPYLQNSNVDFSISHSGDWVWTAFQKNGKIGIDVERTNPINDSISIAKMFHPQEYAEITAAAPGDQLPTFYRCWVRKEATLKAMGTGLATPLNQFCVSTDPNTTDWLPVHPTTPHHPCFTHDITIPNGYACCIASPSPTPTIKILK